MATGWGEIWKQWLPLFSWTPKSLQMVTAAIKLKDTCSLEEKLWQTSLLLFSRSVMSDSLQPMDCSMPGFPALHHLLELAQTHVPWIGDVIQPSHPLLSPSPPAFNLSQHQGLFQWVSQSIGTSDLASVLPMNIQDWFPLGWTVGPPCSPRDSQESSPTPQFKHINTSVLSFLYGPTLTTIHDYWKNHSSD